MNSISGWTLKYPSIGFTVFAPYINSGLYYPFQQKQTTWYAASLKDQLRELSKLDDNWDGYGAAKIEARAVAHAQFVLPSLDISPDHLLPSVAGTILIEWENMLGRASLELGIETFSFYTSPAVGAPILLGGTMQELNVEDINYAVATIAGKAIPQSLEGNNWRVSIESMV